jgi:hypothetical protein
MSLKSGKVGTPIGYMLTLVGLAVGNLNQTKGKAKMKKVRTTVALFPQDLAHIKALKASGLNFADVVHRLMGIANKTFLLDSLDAKIATAEIKLAKVRTAVEAVLLEINQGRPHHER